MGSRFKRSGSALITALILIAILTILGTSRFLLAEQENLAARRTEMRSQAYYLALSGLHYYLFNSAYVQPGMAPVTLAVPEGDTRHFFEVTVDTSYTVHSRGYILGDPKHPVVEETLVMPFGKYSDRYDLHQ